MKLLLIIFRKEREHLGFSQGKLAEKADVSIDTVKSIEKGRRSMSLDTYLKIVQALETTPLALMNRVNCEDYVERFLFITTKRSNEEIEFVLHTDRKSVV